MRVAKVVKFMFVCAVFLLVFQGQVGEAWADDECAGLEGEAFIDCITAQRMRETMFSEESEELLKRSHPVWVGLPVVPRPYGYFLGDLTDVIFSIEVSPEVELDLARVPVEGVRVGAFIVREASTHIENLDKGWRKIVFRFRVQNFVVLCEQNYVPFPPPEIFWRLKGKEKWELIPIEPAAILISPISRCDELPNSGEISLSPLAISRVRVTLVLFGAGSGLLLAGFLLYGISRTLGFNEKRRTSPLYKARMSLRKRSVAPEVAVGALRRAIQFKFGISGTATGDEVLRVLSSSRWTRYALHAQEVADLWEEGVGVLFAGELSSETLVIRIRNVIHKLERREWDEV